MARYRTSRIFPVLLVVVIIIIAIVALVSLARVVFFSGSTPPAGEADVSQEALLSTTADHSVRMTVRGPIVADELFNSYQLTVSPNGRALTTYNGYLDRVVDQVRLGNNVPAYEAFVFALDRAGLASGSEYGDERDDIRGVCATGRVYEFSILEDSKSVKTLWSATCRGANGTLDGSTSQIRELFHDQIPDADELLREIDF